MTPEMKGFVNYDLLRKMKPTAYLINEMRGALVVDDDLKRALEEGVIAGAALDVFNKEPTPVDFPLLKAPHLIATPHTGASTYRRHDHTDPSTGRHEKNDGQCTSNHLLSLYPLRNVWTVLAGSAHA